jgi:hypothetical protein
MMGCCTSSLELFISRVTGLELSLGSMFSTCCITIGPSSLEISIR